MKQSRPVWMAFYWSDFFSDSNVELMDNTQLGIYWRLMRHAWSANPPCSVPSDNNSLRKIAQCEPYDLQEGYDEFEVNIPGVLECFELREDKRYYQKRLEIEFKKASELRESRVKGAVAANASRIQNKELTPSVNAERGAERAQSKRKAISDSPSASSSDSDSDSDSSSEKKRKRSAEGKPKRAAERIFSESPLAEWKDFRSSLADWPENKARFFFDLFVEKEGLHPTKYKYSNWSLAARAWDRRSPGEWNGKTKPMTRSERTIAAARELREEADADHDK